MNRYHMPYPRYRGDPFSREEDRRFAALHAALNAQTMPKLKRNASDELIHEWIAYEDEHNNSPLTKPEKTYE